MVSEADRDQQWLSEIDRVVPLGPSRSSQSYLDADALLEVALAERCSALHPGWGFLSENAEFALRCAASGVTFVGPPVRHLVLMGDKAKARDTMKALGMPVIPGSDGPISTVEEARELAEAIGYPVLLKAVAGGGGRGMRGVDGPDAIEAAWNEASNEALSAFGDDRLYLEKRIVGGRHIEVQVIADAFGTCVHLGERECSLQRRHQKVLEEAPSPGLSDAERARVLPLVADVVRRSGYRNAGTVEMLLDASGHLYFMEMNTRLQVEHPVTEMLTGIDLVEWQLRVAANERLPMTQEQITSHGWAMECRINAEDPADGFRPSPGLVSVLRLPSGEGVRVDTHLTAGDRIPPNYDSMVAKVIVHAESRAEAIGRMREALGDLAVSGVRNNIELHQRILDWEAFRSGEYDTTSLERWLAGEGS